VFIVSVDVPPPPVIDAGLNPPLLTPIGKPPSLVTVRLTFPVNPLIGVTVTVYVADWPGRTTLADGLTAMEKSPVDGVTRMVRVGGLGSELPLASTTVIDTTYVPGLENVTAPGF
jgi:hypothetical protein